jgi:orotidine-5'-phosphate decarboxylase
MGQAMSLLRNPIFCALDTIDLAKAQKLCESLRGHVRGFKLGLEFFVTHGMPGYQKIAQSGAPIFLDLKLHDIPNTVRGAMASLISLKPAFMTVHTAGGGAMMRAAADAAGVLADERPQLLGVTVLTSLDEKDLASVGQGPDIVQQAVRLAKLAKESGLDGVVCSPAEVKMVREACGKDFIIMVPGVRPAWAKSDDQKRVMTPREAMEAGATYLVIGRPITEATNPEDTARRIATELT